MFYGFYLKNQTISQLTVVEVFYKYTPITPLAALAENILLPDYGGIIIGSNSFF